MKTTDTEAFTQLVPEKREQAPRSGLAVSSCDEEYEIRFSLLLGTTCLLPEPGKRATAVSGTDLAEEAKDL